MKELQRAALCILVLWPGTGYSQEIPEGTKIRVRLEQQISSATAEEGQPVQLAVTDDVRVGENVVIAQGATVVGTIVQAVPKRRMGRTGKLDFSIDKVTSSDSGTIPVRYGLVKKEGGSHAVRTGVITAGVAVLFWPAAPFMLLAKGKDTTFNKGMVFEVFTDSSYVLKAKGEADRSRDTGAGTQVSITSEPAGADIEVDGKFVGSTPSTVSLSAGEHKIRVTKGIVTWERSVQISGGSKISLNAVLQ